MPLPGEALLEQVAQIDDLRLGAPGPLGVRQSLLGADAPRSHDTHSLSSPANRVLLMRISLRDGVPPFNDLFHPRSIR